MRFKNGKLIPYHTIVKSGQEITILAEDEKAHTVGVNSKSDFPTSPSKIPFCPRILKFDAPEEGIVVHCDIHAEEIAYVTVVPNPFFTLSSENGTFRLPYGLPPGHYSLRAFHPEYGHVEKKLNSLETILQSI